MKPFFSVFKNVLLRNEFELKICAQESVQLGSWCSRVEENGSVQGKEQCTKRQFLN